MYKPLREHLMDGWVDQRMDEWVDGWVDEQMIDELMDG